MEELPASKHIKPVEVFIARRFRLEKVLGKGSYGIVFKAFDTHANRDVAVKIEFAQGKRVTIAGEFSLYSELAHSMSLDCPLGFSRVYYFARFMNRYILVVDLHGESLQSRLSRLPGPVSLKTLLPIADQLLARIADLHGRNIIHRDIKGENFVFGKGPFHNVLHLVDLGLARHYRDPATGEHIPFSDTAPYIGTIRYLSVNGHNNFELSRRDDLESLGYLLIYHATGDLPWRSSQLDKDPDTLRVDKVARIKRKYTPAQLCQALPVEFQIYMEYVRSLEFDQDPDYYFLRRLFRELHSRLELVYDHWYDWDAPHIQSEAETPDPALVPSAKSHHLSPNAAKGAPNKPTLYHEVSLPGRMLINKADDIPAIVFCNGDQEPEQPESPTSGSLQDASVLGMGVSCPIQIEPTRTVPVRDADDSPTTDDLQHPLYSLSEVDRQILHEGRIPYMMQWIHDNRPAETWGGSAFYHSASVHSEAFYDEEDYDDDEEEDEDEEEEDTDCGDDDCVDSIDMTMGEGDGANIRHSSGTTNAKIREEDSLESSSPSPQRSDQCAIYDDCELFSQITDIITKTLQGRAHTTDYPEVIHSNVEELYDHYEPPNLLDILNQLQSIGISTTISARDSTLQRLFAFIDPTMHVVPGWHPRDGVKLFSHGILNHVVQQLIQCAYTFDYLLRVETLLGIILSVIEHRLADLLEKIQLLKACLPPPLQASTQNQHHSRSKLKALLRRARVYATQQRLDEYIDSFTQPRCDSFTRDGYTPTQRVYYDYHSISLIQCRLRQLIQLRQSLVKVHTTTKQCHKLLHPAKAVCLDMIVLFKQHLYPIITLYRRHLMNRENKQSPSHLAWYVLKNMTAMSSGAQPYMSNTDACSPTSKDTSKDKNQFHQAAPHVGDHQGEQSSRQTNHPLPPPPSLPVSPAQRGAANDHEQQSVGVAYPLPSTRQEQVHADIPNLPNLAPFSHGEEDQRFDAAMLNRLSPVHVPDSTGEQQTGDGHVALRGDPHSDMSDGSFIGAEKNTRPHKELQAHGSVAQGERPPSSSQLNMSASPAQIARESLQQTTFHPPCREMETEEFDDMTSKSLYLLSVILDHSIVLRRTLYSFWSLLVPLASSLQELTEYGRPFYRFTLEVNTQPLTPHSPQAPVPHPHENGPRSVLPLNTANTSTHEAQPHPQSPPPPPPPLPGPSGIMQDSASSRASDFFSWATTTSSAPPFQSWAEFQRLASVLLPDDNEHLQPMPSGLRFDEGDEYDSGYLPQPPLSQHPPSEASTTGGDTDGESSIPTHHQHSWASHSSYTRIAAFHKHPLLQSSIPKLSVNDYGVLLALASRTVALTAQASDDVEQQITDTIRFVQHERTYFYHLAAAIRPSPRRKVIQYMLYLHQQRMLIDTVKRQPPRGHPNDIPSQMATPPLAPSLPRVLPGQQPSSPHRIDPDHRDYLAKYQIGGNAVPASGTEGVAASHQMGFTHEDDAGSGQMDLEEGLSSPLGGIAAYQRFQSQLFEQHALQYSDDNLNPVPLRLFPAFTSNNFDDVLQGVDYPPMHAQQNHAQQNQDTQQSQDSEMSQRHETQSIDRMDDGMVQSVDGPQYDHHYINMDIHVDADSKNHCHWDHGAPQQHQQSQQHHRPYPPPPEFPSDSDALYHAPEQSSSASSSQQSTLRQPYLQQQQQYQNQQQQTDSNASDEYQGEHGSQNDDDSNTATTRYHTDARTTMRDSTIMAEIPELSSGPSCPSSPPTASSSSASIWPSFLLSTTSAAPSSPQQPTSISPPNSESIDGDHLQPKSGDQSSEANSCGQLSRQGDMTDTTCSIDGGSLCHGPISNGGESCDLPSSIASTSPSTQSTSPQSPSSSSMATADPGATSMTTKEFDLSETRHPVGGGEDPQLQHDILAPKAATNDAMQESKPTLASSPESTTHTHFPQWEKKAGGPQPMPTTTTTPGSMQSSSARLLHALFPRHLEAIHSAFTQSLATVDSLAIDGPLADRITYEELDTYPREVIDELLRLEFDTSNNFRFYHSYSKILLNTRLHFKQHLEGYLVASGDPLQTAADAAKSKGPEAGRDENTGSADDHRPQSSSLSSRGGQDSSSLSHSHSQSQSNSGKKRRRKDNGRLVKRFIKRLGHTSPQEHSGMVRLMSLLRAMTTPIPAEFLPGYDYEQQSPGGRVPPASLPNDPKSAAALTGSGPPRSHPQTGGGAVPGMAPTRALHYLDSSTVRAYNASLFFHIIRTSQSAAIKQLTKRMISFTLFKWLQLPSDVVDGMQLDAVDDKAGDNSTSSPRASLATRVMPRSAAPAVLRSAAAPASTRHGRVGILPINPRTKERVKKLKPTFRDTASSCYTSRSTAFEGPSTASPLQTLPRQSSSSTDDNHARTPVVLQRYYAPVSTSRCAKPTVRRVPTQALHQHRGHDDAFTLLSITEE